MSEIIPPPENPKDAVYCCADCDWHVNLKEENSGDDLNKRLIQHHVETAHTVVRQSAIAPGYDHAAIDN